MRNKVYDVLKWISIVFLPFVASIYFGMGQIWGLPAIEQVIGTIAVLETAIGVLLTKSSISYEESQPQLVGDIIVKQDQFGTVSGMSMQAHKDPLILPADE